MCKLYTDFFGDKRMNALLNYLKQSLTAYHAVDNAKNFLLSCGFTQLLETEDWQLCEGGKYFVVRNGSSLVAFTVGSLDGFHYKIAASHPDSPALKLKENCVNQGNLYATLSTEPYGVGIWSTFFDRPLKVAGRAIVKAGNKLTEKTVQSPFNVYLPSLAIHQNRDANNGIAINNQIDLQPLLSCANNAPNAEEFIKKVVGEDAVAYDLYIVNADTPYSFGVNDEFVAAPRVDNLTSVYASLLALTQSECKDGVCVMACLDSEEVGSATYQGADSDFLENTLRRIAYALRFDENEYCKALASSFLLSVDNAHAIHPNHPEKSDLTNKTTLGGGVVIKNHSGKAYITDATAAALTKTIFSNANVKYQTFFNRSDVRSGGTLGAFAIRHLGVYGADIGIAQLAMHSACECFAIADYHEEVNGLTAFYNTKLTRVEDGFILE